MIIFCTYCSARKYRVDYPMPAIEVYRSERINHVHRAAQEANAECLILSGKYGLLSTADKIAYYDHLLKAEEVDAHAQLLVLQLQEKGVSKVIFWMNSIKRDHQLEPYLDCIELACKRALVPIEIRVAQFDD
ncbi:MAG: hypothetical protein P8O07_08420 [Crocinitomicaceae bacterium]|nr:hypothetical protein [Crocinitomicaceae bacterium]